MRVLHAGDHDEAVARLKASYELSPEPEVIFELAEAYRGKGDPILAATAAIWPRPRLARTASARASGCGSSKRDSASQRPGLAPSPSRSRRSGAAV